MNINDVALILNTRDEVTDLRARASCLELLNSRLKTENDTLKKDITTLGTKIDKAHDREMKLVGESEANRREAEIHRGRVKRLEDEVDRLLKVTNEDNVKRQKLRSSVALLLKKSIGNDNEDDTVRDALSMLKEGVMG